MSQTSKLKELLLDTDPHNTLEIRQVVYGNEILNMARIAARVNDLKKQGYLIKGWKENGKYWYQMMPAPIKWQIAAINYPTIEEQVMARMLK